MKNTSSSTFAATVTVITVDQNDDFGFSNTTINIGTGEDPVLIIFPAVFVVSETRGLVESFFEGEAGTKENTFIIGRNSELGFDLLRNARKLVM